MKAYHILVRTPIIGNSQCLRRLWFVLIAWALCVMPLGISNGHPLDSARAKIESIRELSSKKDTVHINETISIKVKTTLSLDSLTTLYIDNIPIKGLFRKAMADEGVIFFKMGQPAQDLLNQYLDSESLYNNIIPIDVSLGNSKKILSNSWPLYFRVKQKIPTAWITGILIAILLAGTYGVLTKNIRTGMSRMLMDDKNKFYSLGRMQLAFWTLLFSLCYLVIWFMTSTLPDITNTTLIVLGISAGTTAAARIVNHNSNGAAPSGMSTSATTPSAAANQPTSETGATPPMASQPASAAAPLAQASARAGDSQGWLVDILSDGSSISVHRFQNVLFTFVFGAIFLQVSLTSLALPEFDGNALLLMGISSGTYAGLKITEAK